MTPTGRAARRWLRKFPGGRRAALWLRDHLDPQARSVARIARESPDGLFQPLAETSANRYPVIFATVANALADRPAPRLLSYGCSTGEEAFSLVALMPQARVTGIDINPHNIAVALRRSATLGADAPRFICAGSPDALADGSFDAIFCMAVTRHATLEAERPLDCSPWLRFEQFDALMTNFDRLLTPGGVLAIWNSHFRFGDSGVAHRFTPIFYRPPTPANPPLYYGPDNRRVDGELAYMAAVFRKREPAQIAPALRFAQGSIK
jgi:SAM-dependent methyltransferase